MEMIGGHSNNKNGDYDDDNDDNSSNQENKRTNKVEIFYGRWMKQYSNQSQQHVRQQIRWENQHGAKSSNNNAVVIVNECVCVNHVHWTNGRGKQ